MCQLVTPILYLCQHELGVHDGVPRQFLRRCPYAGCCLWPCPTQLSPKRTCEMVPVCCPQCHKSAYSSLDAIEQAVLRYENDMGFSHRPQQDHSQSGIGLAYRLDQHMLEHVRTLKSDHQPKRYRALRRFLGRAIFNRVAGLSALQGPVPQHLKDHAGQFSDLNYSTANHFTGSLEASRRTPAPINLTFDASGAPYYDIRSNAAPGIITSSRLSPSRPEKLSSEYDHRTGNAANTEQIGVASKIHQTVSSLGTVTGKTSNTRTQTTRAPSIIMDQHRLNQAVPVFLEAVNGRDLVPDSPRASVIPNIKSPLSNIVSYCKAASKEISRLPFRAVNQPISQVRRAPALESIRTSQAVDIRCPSLDSLAARSLANPMSQRVRELTAQRLRTYSSCCSGNSLSIGRSTLADEFGILEDHPDNYHQTLADELDTIETDSIHSALFSIGSSASSFHHVPARDEDCDLDNLVQPGSDLALSSLITTTTSIPINPHYSAATARTQIPTPSDLTITPYNSLPSSPSEMGATLSPTTYSERSTPSPRSPSLTGAFADFDWSHENSTSPPMSPPVSPGSLREMLPSRPSDPFIRGLRLSNRYSALNEMGELLEDVDPADDEPILGDEAERAPKPWLSPISGKEEEEERRSREMYRTTQGD